MSTYWNDVEEAASDRHTGKAQAWVDYHLADYGARVTALTTMDGTLGTPWTEFLEDFAVAERSWWSTQKGQYLAYVGKVNAEAEGYQSTAGGKFLGMVESITTADVAWMTTAAPALGTEARNMATAESRYAGRHATAKQDYQVDHATAMRDFTVNEDASAKKAALAQAAKKYGIAEVSADADRKVDLAKAGQQYVDAAQAATLTWTGTKSRAVRDFEVAESQAWRDRRVNLAELDGDYAVEEADSYADAIELLATTRPTPWASLDAQQARAWAIDQDEWSQEALKSATASADAALAEERTKAEAEQRRAMDEARVKAKEEKAKAQAEVTKAEQERDAANRQAQAGAATVGTPDPVAPATSKAPQIDQAPPEDYTENRQSEKDDSHTLGDWSKLPIVRDQTDTTPAEKIDILVTPGKDESVVGDKAEGDGTWSIVVIPGDWVEESPQGTDQHGTLTTATREEIAELSKSVVDLAYARKRAHDNHYAALQRRDGAWFFPAGAGEDANKALEDCHKLQAEIEKLRAFLQGDRELAAQVLPAEVYAQLDSEYGFLEAMMALGQKNAWLIEGHGIPRCFNPAEFVFVVVALPVLMAAAPVAGAAAGVRGAAGAEAGLGARTLAGSEAAAVVRGAARARLRAPSAFTPKVTPKGIARVEQHLAQFGDDAANQAMIARLKAGQTSAQDINFYMHELKESAVMGRTQGAFSDVYEWQRAAHLETLNWQKIPYAPGYESQLFHPDVIRQFPQQFNPPAWPK